MKERIKVLAADDHTLFRKGTVMLLQTFPEIEEVYEAENGQKALQQLETHKVDVVLLDLDMPVLDGFETSKRILAKYPDTHIIILSMNESLKTISDLIEMGVHSYLLKNAETEEVHRAILAVLNNDFYYNQIVAKALHQKVQNESEQNTTIESTDLTKREIEILRLICQELTMKEIGDQLFLSEQTVQTHRKNLMRKTKVKNGVGLVKFAIQSHIISL